MCSYNRFVKNRHFVACINTQNLLGQIYFEQIYMDQKPDNNPQKPLRLEYLVSFLYKFPYPHLGLPILNISQLYLLVTRL